MSLPQASLLPASKVPRSPASRWRQHLLVLGIIGGCATNVAIWNYAAERRTQRAEEQLLIRIGMDNRQALLTQAYLEHKRLERPRPERR